MPQCPPTTASTCAQSKQASGRRVTGFPSAVVSFRGWRCAACCTHVQWEPARWWCSRAWPGLRLALAGDLDSAFGSSGRVILTPGLDSSASSEAAQADGKIVLAGTVNNGPPPPPGPPLAPGVPDESFADFLAVRIAANGALDQSFGSGGFAQVPIDLGATNRDIANAVAVGPNGTVVLAGNAATSVPSNSFDSAVVRLTAEGDPDPSFAGDGIQTVDVGNADDVYGVAVQDDGKVVAVGGGSNGFTLFRLDTDGSLDPGFGTGGIADTVIGDPASRDQAMAVAVSVGGEIVVAGASDIDYPNISAVAMVRYLPNGQPDPTFGTDGIVVTPGPPGESAAALALAFQPDGKAVIGGDVGCIGCAKGFLLARYRGPARSTTPLAAAASSRQASRAAAPRSCRRSPSTPTARSSRPGTHRPRTGRISLLPATTETARWTLHSAPMESKRTTLAEARSAAGY